MIDYQNSALLNLIKSQPAGIKEYDLLKLLQEQLPENERVTRFDNLVLFQQHFLLFHALYKLNDQLHADQAGQLLIGALNIQWLPHTTDNNVNSLVGHIPFDLVKSDPLREYYLDIKNLQDTSSEDVDNLLASFWMNLDDDEEKASALALFELNEPCDLVMIKKRYRELLSVHHPDKGGCVEMTQSLNDAMAVLKRCYTCNPAI
ncbi:DNA-J related domain-containing protein [Psychromonas algicola]|uniref:DNA-J related domain-containing protein n=1 Tax=Psychromonas algicola TaxID=2555642 RepID=UPI001ABB8A06|nr:DNA-J related domain-containing protein [Psychromonas sp. RZ5]